MREQIKTGFSQIVMPKECEAAIESALKNRIQETKPEKRIVRLIPRPAMAAAAMIAVLLIGEGTAYACTGSGIVSLAVSFARNAFITKSVDENGMESGSVTFDTSQATAPAEYKDGKLIFTANGENMDITKEVSDTTAFVHTYVDGEQVTHYLIIGGKPESFGYAEFMKDANQNWLGGYYQGGVTGEDINPQWLENTKRELNIPW